MQIWICVILLIILLGTEKDRHLLAEVLFYFSIGIVAVVLIVLMTSWL
jgi:hypothetical protein